MKTRIALFLAALLTITGAAFANDGPTRMERREQRQADRPETDPRDQAAREIKVPFIFDGVEFPAGTKLPDQSLTFVLTPDDIAKGTVHVFSNRELAKVFVDRDVAKTSGGDVSTNGVAGRDVRVNSCTWTEQYSWFNTAVGCGNSGVLTLYPFGEYSNLDFGGWNNTISCVKAACIGYYTVLYACRNFQTYSDSSCADPDALYVPSGFVVTDLNNYGFNNRASSIRFE
jgi:hypothetical protein